MRTLTEWIVFVVQTHHGFLRAHLPQMEARLEESQDQNPSYSELLELFLDFKRELNQHISKEEVMLFPSFRHLEMCERDSLKPDLSRYDIRESLAGAEQEHEATESYLFEIKTLLETMELSEVLRNDFDRLEEDLKEHMRLEETEIFPEARRIYADLTRDLLREE